MKLYNSLTNSKQEFIPINRKKASMYVCGITPYDTTHLGHAFTYVFFDTLRRFLEFKGHKVTYTQNITDIDDDILKKAKEVGRDWQEFGDFWTKQFLSDMKVLNVKVPTHYIKATAALDIIVVMVKGLLAKGFAYENQGNVYFEVSKFSNYGQLSKLTRGQMLPLEDERGGNTHDPLKKNPLDFILWQKSKKGEPSWDSPWGKGRPGWHIECSAMNLKTLGEQIDIHGGGADLIYPHHESEIAQSESATSKSPFVKYWMHVGMLSFEGEKMSKSLGNLVLVKDLLDKYSANVIRWLLLSHHYREAWEFKVGELNQTEEFMRSLKPLEASQDVKQQMVEALEDDINTPKMLSLLKNNPDSEMLNLLGFDLQSFH